MLESVGEIPPTRSYLIGRLLLSDKGPTVEVERRFNKLKKDERCNVIVGWIGILLLYLTDYSGSKSDVVTFLHGMAHDIEEDEFWGSETKKP